MTHGEYGDYISTTLSFDQVALILLFLALAVIILLCSFFKRTLTKAERLTAEDIKDFENGIQLAEGEEESDQCEVPLRRPYDSKYEMQRTKFVFDKQKVLGHGEFAVVYRGKMEGTDFDVAVKTAKSGRSVEHLKSLLVEIKLLIYIENHPNVVGIHGAHTGEIRKGGIYILLEFCSKGCLETLLRNSTLITDGRGPMPPRDPEDVNIVNDQSIANRQSINDGREELSSLNLFKWCYHIASGMEYLSNKKVVHADLATRNVLVTGENIAKISHFGLSRKMYSYTKHLKDNQEPLSWRWMAIESLRRLSFTTETDIWSYGVTLWEIFTLGNIPYPGVSWGTEFVEKLERGLRLHKPKHCSPDIYSEISRCWRKEPSERPKFDEFTRLFGQILVEKNPEYEKDYLKLID